VPSSRRQLLTTLAALPFGAAPGCRREPQSLRRWRGFNLQEKFTDRPDEWANLAPEWGRRNEPFAESDFAWMAGWGFNFARLPMSYRCWTDPRDPLRLLEQPLGDIDQAVEWGRRYGVHVCLNFHRAPGYCINGSLLAEPWDLWTDPKALDIFVFHWTHFAARYRGIASEHLSFNLINEPSRCTPDQYARVMRRAAGAIREVDPARLVVVDGLFGEAMRPATELGDLPNAVHANRGYAPFALSHYLAPWAGTPRQLPAWPMRTDAALWNAETLRRWSIQPWEELRTRGVPIVVGEWGCWNRTPHHVTLAWMRDFLTLWKSAGFGWALWCFRGSFGILDSHRSDVAHENWRGHQLDRKMLELLREF
jgi:endoglucanase